MNLKKQLHRFMKLQDLTIVTLAKKSGVPKSSIADWLAGVTPRKFDHIKKVADALHVPLETLVFGDGVGKSEILEPTEVDALVDGQLVTGKFELTIRRIK